MSGQTFEKTQGEWFYTHDQEFDLLQEIVDHGWKPEAFTNSKYGCAIYLSRTPWYSGASEALVCEVTLPDKEVMDTFPAAKGWEAEGEGNSYKHLGRYLQAENVIQGNHPPAERGDSKQNVAIRDHFCSKGIKAVRIDEHAHDVIIVFDTGAIKVVEKRSLNAADSGRE